jgi:hypothetical protein
MATDKKFNLDGFSVDENNVCTANGGFVGEVTGNLTGNLIGDVTQATTEVLDVYGGSIEMYSTGLSGSVAIGVGSAPTAATGEIVISGDFLKLPSLPTSDPLSAGQLWNDSGTLKISAG